MNQKNNKKQIRTNFNGAITKLLQKNLNKIFVTSKKQRYIQYMQLINKKNFMCNPNNIK